eukprot:12887261-Prorocentrum_lima.AAC.1
MKLLLQRKRPPQHPNRMEATPNIQSALPSSKYSWMKWTVPIAYSLEKSLPMIVKPSFILLDMKMVMGKK